MNQQNNINFAFSFESTQTPAAIFEILSDVRQWWVGLYSEEINGESKQLNDIFTFVAGGDVHYSKQQAIELVPNKKIVWKVIDSKLSFLKQADEWTGTAFGFEIDAHANGSKITFTHQGLVPQIECYNDCSSAWTAYMQKLALNLK